ncbi:universal stress protein [Halobellus rarus]|uniref:Universal stress protein n=1 Tax=Halobellus rarus TaxID=1126237 RepID=A0ABD6CJC2_9EURY|nr:universal stress protein [Halobellus rarus]
MSMNTVLLAFGPNDEQRIDELLDTATSIVDPDGTIVLLHAFDRKQYDAIAEKLNIDDDAESTPDDIARRSRVGREIAERLDRAGIDYVVRGAIGETSDAILRQSELEDADLVVVGGRSRSATGKALFGSTAQKVLVEADCPVTFVKEQSATKKKAAAPA